MVNANPASAANAELDATVIERMTIGPANLARGADEEAITTRYRPQNATDFLAAMSDLEVQAYLGRIGAPPLPDDVQSTIAKIRSGRTGRPSADA